jgi:queuine/archaeosine tRNA-ribosyltransferase
MGILINFCAGADLNTLPADKVKGLLINALDNGANLRKIQAAREMRHVLESKYLMLDSSGFQLLKGEEKGKRLSFDPCLPMKHTARVINLAPRHVLEAASLIQPDIVVGLDFPVRKLKTAAEKEAEFLRKLPYNVRWAFESAQWWNEFHPQARFFLPIQCYDLNQLKIFFQQTSGLTYDGVSMPIRGLKISEIALFLVGFHQRGIKRVHLLGTSSFPVIALCAYAAKHLFDWVSLDATTWRMAADKGEFLNQYNLSRVKLNPNVDIPAGKANNCPCPFCNGLNFGAIQGLERKKKIDLLRRHNWWSVEQAFADLEKSSSDIVSLEKFMLERTHKVAMVDELVKTLSLVDNFKGVDVSLLEMLLAPEPKVRKPTRTSRRQTVTNQKVAETVQLHSGSDPS